MHDFDEEEEARQPLNNKARARNQQYDPYALVKKANLQDRLGFVRKVYGILVAQILVTVCIAGFIVSNAQNQEWLRSNEWLLWVSVFGTIVTICVMSCCESAMRSSPTNYIFLFAFTAFEAIMIGFVSSVFTWQSLMLAVGVLGLIFVGLTVYSFNTSRDFTGYGPYAFVALFALCIFGLLIGLLPAFGIHTQVAILIYDCIAVILFSFYIVLDTQMMMGAYGGHEVQFNLDDYVFAALHLYLDIVNLFLLLLSLFGQRDGSL